MANNFVTRLQHAWNAFTSRDPTPSLSFGSPVYERPGSHHYYNNDRSIVTNVVNRIAVDCAQIDIRHVKLDEERNFQKEMNSYLNKVLSSSANLDQTGRAFIQDLVHSMLDEGVVAAVPVETDVNPETGSFDITQLRVGQITGWYADRVKMLVYDERAGRKREMVAKKSVVAIIENPFSSIMNAPNSTLKRLMRTLYNLDVLNDANASGKLNLIVQFPQLLKTPLKRQQADARIAGFENQLLHSKYGIAYTDGSEHITQLNRPLENNLWIEAQDLTNMLFNQLGLTQSVFDGTATPSTLNNYYNRTIAPILTCVTEEMERKFLTKTARSQRQAIIYIYDPFSLNTATEIAEMAKTFTSCEVMTSNEVRSKLGLKPVDTERANDLVNKNINKVDETPAQMEGQQETNNVLQNEEEE